MEGEGLRLFPSILFVDFVASTVCVIVSGRCPSCNVLHAQNICNIRFVKEYVQFLLTIRFELMEKVIHILTYDDNYYSVIMSFGGVISYPFTTNEKQRMINFQRFMLDLNPNMDGYANMLVQHDPNGIYISQTSVVSWKDVVENYDAC